MVPFLPMATSASWSIFPPQSATQRRAAAAWAWAVGQTVTMTACGDVRQKSAAVRSAVITVRSPGREMRRVAGRARELKAAAHPSSESKSAMRQWYGIERRKEMAQAAARCSNSSYHPTIELKVRAVLAKPRAKVPETRLVSYWPLARLI